jgi:hypothetical protein
MSQRAGSLSYQVFASGFSLAWYALFRLAVRSEGWQLSIFGIFGANALAAYLLQSVLEFPSHFFAIATRAVAGDGDHSAFIADERAVVGDESPRLVSATVVAWEASVHASRRRMSAAARGDARLPRSVLVFRRSNSRRRATSTRS